MKEHVGVIGAGSWATALAALLAKKGRRVIMYARRPELAEEINITRENSRYLPGVAIHPNIEVTVDLERAFRKARVVVFGVPSHAFREVVRQSRPFLKNDTIYVNTAKGIEETSLSSMSAVFAQEAGTELLQKYAGLSGPSHAEEVGRELPTAVVAASYRLETAEYVQELFMSDRFRVYTNPDVLGVELGGALKNIIALGTGIAEGLSFGDNTKAALMTRGLAEITRLGVIMGANPLTFAGLAGVGDLIVTCTSMHSRNRRAGIAIGKGSSVEEALELVDMVVEGVRTTRAAHQLSARYAVEMPITDQIYKVLFEGLAPGTAVNNLMSRGRTREMEEVAKMTVKLLNNN
ncbi:NAD(P)H-dependent glycerol-3-phosphate dehydrogenase [Pelotomaculum isophthalicicum JI]|uniref:Glycerol-3-phosphate dehydrogenase [NAD(P)+] n=1 Tax=Pelotomaculum isophthalicicum JI TaxID=947010 RepID=A0A9X4JV08_9FIRM|nr:NAD(P)H-dependent glycerol-3-phosphate dehydrogenase [Pelotomaculum isophthalicicum]MDF9407361.1 NAD(P)H-dependent glycerol-3-phosphate dehydrogenase [Pelotomaculum isophthalicicum JI]